MASSIRERQRNNPALYLDEVYRYILRDDALLESLRSRRRADARCRESLIQEVANWMHSEQDAVGAEELLRIKRVISSVASSLPTVLQGGTLWKKWRALLQDVFFWFEYLYEESAGDSSAWQRSSFCSSFSHSVNVRIPIECRAFYEEKMCLKDSHNIRRGEIIKTLAFDEAALRRESGFLTTSQSAVLRMETINKQLGMPPPDLGTSEEADLPAPPGHGVPTYVEEDCGKLYIGPLRDGELVVRFFGMKEEDDQFMSGNILVVEVADPPCGRPRSRSKGRASAAELASYGRALGRSVLGKPLLVHAGFWKAFQSLNRGCLASFGMDLPARIVSQWEQQQMEYPDTEKRRLVLTGHSMGAAFACFAAFCLHARYHETHPELIDNMVLLLIGSPKFARLRFTNWMNGHFAGRVLRLELQGDHIVDMPPLPGWFAPGNRVLMSRLPLEQAIANVGEEVKFDSHHFSYWNVIRHAIIQFTLTPDSSLLSPELKIEDDEFRRLVAAGDVAALSSVEPGILRATVTTYNDQYNQGALHAGAASGSLAVLELLLRHGAKINKRDNCFWTPLHRACNDARWDAALFLIAQGAVADARSDSESTPIIYVCQHPVTPADWNGPRQVLEALLEKGADVMHRNLNGECPLVRAVKAVQHTNCLLTVAWLLGHGASVAASDTVVIHPAGFAVLHMAVLTGNRELIHLLLEAGADPDYQLTSERNFKFKSARQLAHQLKPELGDVFDDEGC